MACTAEKRNDVIRLLEDERPRKRAEFPTEEATHSQSKELTRQTQAQLQDADGIAPASSEATHPQLITALGRETSAQLHGRDPLISMSYGNQLYTPPVRVSIVHTYTHHKSETPIHQEDTFQQHILFSRTSLPDVGTQHWKYLDPRRYRAWNCH